MIIDAIDAMYNRSKTLDCPDTYPFPFTPYDIQYEFMRAMYSVIENRKIGIFESPTGTGKTLTLMCSTLKWLHDHDELNFSDLREQIAARQLKIAESERANAATNDWMSEQFQLLQTKNELAKMRQQLDAMETHDRQVSEMREKWQQQRQKQKKVSGRAFEKRKKSAEDLLEDEVVASDDKRTKDGDEYAIDDSDDDDDDENGLVEVDNDNVDDSGYHDTKVS